MGVILTYEKEFETYFDTVRKSDKSATEYTHRTAMENLLNVIKSDKTFQVLHEPKKFKRDEGKPDFQVFKDGLLIGYLEMKPVGTDLDKIMQKDSTTREAKQLQRYLIASPTLILSNYTDFVLFQSGTKVKTISLFNIKDKTLETSKIERASLYASNKNVPVPVAKSRTVTFGSFSPSTLNSFLRR